MIADIRAIVTSSAGTLNHRLTERVIESTHARKRNRVRVEDLLPSCDCFAGRIPVTHVPKSAASFPGPLSEAQERNNCIATGLNGVPVGFRPIGSLIPDVKLFIGQYLRPAFRASRMQRPGLFVPYLCREQAQDKFGDGVQLSVRRRGDSLRMSQDGARGLLLQICFQMFQLLDGLERVSPSHITALRNRTLVPGSGLRNSESSPSDA